MNPDLHPDLTIVLLGKAGVGKSASGNTILGRPAFKSETAFTSVTEEISEEKGNVCGKQISVVDTPGILESKDKDEKIKRWCQELLQSSRRCLFLVVLRVGRFTKEDQEAVKAAERVLGTRGLKETYLLFTRGDALQDKSLEDFIFQGEGEDTLPDVVKMFAGAYHLFNNEDDDEEQVRELLLKSGHLTTHQQPDLPADVSRDRRVMLFGLPGSGKSVSGNTILGSDQFKSAGDFNSVSTKTVSKSAVVEGRKVTVVDTPGLTDEVLTPKQLYLEIMKPIVEASPGPHALVIVVKIGRITKADVKLFELLLKLFDGGADRYSMVLFTHGDQLKGQSIEDGIKSNTLVSDLVSMCGGRYCVFDNRAKRSREQVRNLLNQVDEMVTENGGEHYTDEMFRMAEMFFKEERNRSDGSGDNVKEKVWKRIGRYALIGAGIGLSAGALVAVAAVVGAVGAVGAAGAAVVGAAAEAAAVGAAAVGAAVGAAAAGAAAGAAADEEQVRDLLLKSGHPPTHQQPDPPADVSRDRRVVLFGLPGAGKTASGNTILGSDQFKSAGDFNSVSTKTVSKSAVVEGRKVTVVDTPGFTDEVLTPEQLYLEIMKPLVKARPGPHAFIIVVRIGRITKADITLFELLLKLFDGRADRYSMVLFTHGDELKGQSIEDGIKSNTLVSDLVSMCGGRYCVFDNGAKRSREQVRNLLNQIDEMVTANGGEHYTDEMFRMAEKLFKEERNRSGGSGDDKDDEDHNDHKDGTRGFARVLDLHPDLTIVLLGKTGVGKSASGNTILGRPAFKSELALKSVTEEISEEKGNVCGKQISVVDTPGILDSKDKEKKIKSCCQELLQSSRRCLFLVVLRVGRFIEEDQEAVKAAERVLGSRGLKKSYLLFTGGDALKHKSLDDFIFQDKDTLPEVVKRFAGAYHLFNNEDDDEEQVRELLLKSGHLTTHQQPDPPADVSRDRRVVLFGLPGAGKSVSGNTILGSDQFKSAGGFDSVSTETVSKSAVVEGRKVTVVDTPGFTDEVLTPEQLYLEIMKPIVKASPGPHALVIVVRIGRITKADVKLFKLLPKLFDGGADRYSMVLFTHGDQLKGQSIEDEIKSNKLVSDLVSMCGGRYCVFDNRAKRSREQVRNLLNQIDEMVTENGGEHYTDEMFRMVQTFFKEEMRDFRSSRRRDGSIE